MRPWYRRGLPGWIVTGPGTPSGPLPSFIGFTSGQGIAAVTLAKPAASIVAGDLMVTALETGSSSIGVYPKGWVPVVPPPQIQSFNGSSQSLAIFYKVADAVDIAAANLGIWGGSDPTGVCMGFFRNPRGKGGWNTAGFAMTDNATGAAVLVPPYFPIVGNLLVVAAIATAGSSTNAAITTPTDYANVASFNGLGASFPMWLGYQFSSAGAQIGPSSATANGTVTFTWGTILAAFSLP